MLDVNYISIKLKKIKNCYQPVRILCHLAPCSTTWLKKAMLASRMKKEAWKNLVPKMSQMVTCPKCRNDSKCNGKAAGIGGRAAGVSPPLHPVWKQFLLTWYIRKDVSKMCYCSPEFIFKIKLVISSKLCHSEPLAELCGNWKNPSLICHRIGAIMWLNYSSWSCSYPFLDTTAKLLTWWLKCIIKWDGWPEIKL